MASQAESRYSFTTVDSKEIFRLAKWLDEATQNAREVERLTLAQPQLSLDDAYRIQDAGIELRRGRGETLVGYKMGLTSQAKRQQMNLDSAIYGILTGKMALDSHRPFSLRGSIHPKIEPEIAFLIGRDVRGPIDAEQALEACSGVCAAMEILDSRYLNFKYFSLPDVIADNCSSAYFVLSETILSPKDVDVADLLMRMEVNGQVAQQASSKAISGHPIQSVVELCKMLSFRNLVLPKGSVVLAGAATQAVALEPGMQVRLIVEKLGDVSLNIDLK